MDTSRERDQSIERLLRQSLRTPRPAGATESCLDAETLAAWVDGGLSGAALESTQSHVADCVRCQSLVGAMARTNAAAPQPGRERAPRRWLGWLVPLAAAATAVALWVAIPRETSAPVVPAAPAAEVRKDAADATAQQPSSRGGQLQSPATVGQEGRARQDAASTVERQSPAPASSDAAGRLEPDSLQQRDAVPAPAAAAPPAPPPVEAEASARSANVLAERAGIDVAAPESSVRWRIAGSVVERSANGGGSWAAVPTGVAAEFTALAAPSADVSWVVGHGGVVLLSIDGGRSWRRVAFSEITDLSAVRATDARTASVSTADGRTFSTSDGGVTWVGP